MAAKSKAWRAVTEEVRTIDGGAYEVAKDVLVVDETPCENSDVFQTVYPAQDCVQVDDARRQRAQQLLDRLRQNAMASRDPRAWDRYQGATEMAERLGYTIEVKRERFPTLLG